MLAQMRWATVVITREARRIRAFAGAGSSAAPALQACAAWRASSSFICLTTARDACRPRAGGRGGRPDGPPPGARSRPRSPGSADRRAGRRPGPGRRRPHTRADSAATAGRPVRRAAAASRPDGRFPRAPPRSKCARRAGSRVTAACAVYRAWAQTSPTWFTRISAPASRRSASLSSPAGAVGRGAARGRMRLGKQGAQRRVGGGQNGVERTVHGAIGTDAEIALMRDGLVSHRGVAEGRRSFVALLQRNAARHPRFRANCFALTKRLWCNSDNFPKGGWPGVRWEHKSASHGEPFAPEPYV